MDMQELVNAVTTLSTQFDEAKFWLMGVLGLLGVVAAVVVAAASSYVKAKVKSGIEQGAKEAQILLDKSVSIENRILELEKNCMAIAPIWKCLKKTYFL